MNTFKSINSHLNLYLNQFKSLEPTHFNDELAKSTARQLSKYKDALEKLDTHPLKIEAISKMDTHQLCGNLKCIRDLFLKHMTSNDDVIEICNSALRIQPTLNILVAHSELAHLQSLDPLTQKLKTMAKEASSKIAQHVQIYREGPQTLTEAQKTLRALSHVLTLLYKELIPLPEKLIELKKITKKWLDQKRSAPDDFTALVKGYVPALHQILLKISDSLIYESEQFHATINSLTYPIKQPGKSPINAEYSSHANSILNHFQQMDLLSEQIITKINEENTDWFIVLYNSYRLQDMIAEAMALMIQLPQNLRNAINQHKQELTEIKLFFRLAHSPEMTLEERTMCQKRCDVYYADQKRLNYTLDHIDELSQHPHFVNALNCLEQLRTHPKIASESKGKLFPTPFSFESDFWMLHSIQIHSLNDAEAFYHSILNYSENFFALLSFFLSKSTATNRQSFLSPWPLLIELEELIALL